MAETASSGARSVERKTVLNVTRRKVGRAGAPVLPDDLVMWEIFYRLPAKEILRCGAACRSWRRLSRDAEFLLAHHHRQPSLPLVYFRTRTNVYTFDASVDSFDLRRTPAVRRPVLWFNGYNDRRNFSIHASYDGLLLLSVANGRFFICNPVTCQWLGLPALTGGNVAALYPHRLSGEYRVLYWKHPNKSGSPDYYVLTVGSSQGSRYIGLPVASPSMKNDTTRWRLIHACEQPPVLLHDCLHWYATGKVVVFDTLVESFKWMKSPVATNSAQLLQMNGTLGIGNTDIDGDTMIAEVWVLQDYKMEIWSPKYKIELPLAVMKELCGTCSFHYQAVCENGDMLVILRYTMPCHPWLYLFHFDSKGKLVEKFYLEKVDSVVLGLSFKESLVRHVFFQRKDACRVTVPRFFRGL